MFVLDATGKLAVEQAVSAFLLLVVCDSHPGHPLLPLQDPRYMYLSLDEACTHVDAPAFRLVAGVYNRQGSRLLATAVSPPIRCASAASRFLSNQCGRFAPAIHSALFSSHLLTCVAMSVCSVLANNDVPTGAARIKLEARLLSDWEGWAAEGGGQAGGRASVAPKARKAAGQPTRRNLVVS
jgi:hypothetical protein